MGSPAYLYTYILVEASKSLKNRNAFQHKVIRVHRLGVFFHPIWLCSRLLLCNALVTITTTKVCEYDQVCAKGKYQDETEKSVCEAHIVKRNRKILTIQ